jgi:5-methylcytosine-specific restriction endonuclease McrA
MQKHIKNFTKHYNLLEGEIMMCQYCRSKPVTDIHHIVYRSQGGSDEVDNLIGLCRLCHQQAHKQAKPYLTVQELFKAKNKTGTIYTSTIPFYTK